MRQSEPAIRKQDVRKGWVGCTTWFLTDEAGGITATIVRDGAASPVKDERESDLELNVLTAAAILRVCFSLEKNRV